MLFVSSSAALRQFDGRSASADSSSRLTGSEGETATARIRSQLSISGGDGLQHSSFTKVAPIFSSAA